MQITSTQTKKLLTGNYSFSMLALSMLITKMKGDYGKNPTPAMLDKSTAEINTFIGKYAAVMQADLAIISKL